MLSEIEVGAHFVYVYSIYTYKLPQVNGLRHTFQNFDFPGRRKKQLPWIVWLLLKLFLWDIKSIKLKVTVELCIIVRYI